MNIPNLPPPNQPLHDQNGNIHPAWYYFLSQITQEMQNNLSQEGIKIPMQPTANISKIQTISPDPSFIYDSNLHTVKVAINGVFKTVQTA